MVSHRRASVVARALRRLRRSPKAAIPAPRRAGIELVDAQTRVTHRVSPHRLLARPPAWESPSAVWCPDTGRKPHRPGASPVSGVRVVSDPRVEIKAVCEMHQSPGPLVKRRLLLPDPVFARRTSAGRRLSDAPASVPGGQPIPPRCPPAAHDGPPSPQGRLPRWARYPVDQRLHLLSADEVATAGDKGHGRAACDRLIPAAGLTIKGASAGFCMGCLAVGTAR